MKPFARNWESKPVTVGGKKGHGRIMPRFTEMFFSPLQAADYAGLKIEAIYELLESGEIVGDQTDGRWRFRKSAMDTWLDADVPPEELKKLAGHLRHLTEEQAHQLIDEIQDGEDNPS